MENLDRHIISCEASVLEALSRLNALSGKVMTLLVVNTDGRMAGTLTDGDIRRALLAGVKLHDKVESAMCRDFKFLPCEGDNASLMREYRKKKLSLIPVLASDGTIVDVVDAQVTHTILPLSAILMAGGKGQRLLPLTLDCPKPLLKVGEKAIIDYNIEALAKVGVKDVTVMVNYLAEQIEEHFSRPVAGIDVRCIREPEFLGTIGAASLVPHRPGGDTLVMNSDLLTTLSIEEMYFTHKHQGADVTIAAVPYSVSIPYAILSTDGHRVTSLEEKPSYSYYANAGIYIFSNRVLDMIPKGERMDAPELIELAINRDFKVVYHPINGTWIDIGSPVDFAHACELMSFRK